ncbi:MAG: PKD domain-containing protein [Pirellulaceae bacterium]|nr:PKD domain-containing protein [Pirellulaceae bacterium]
MQLVASGGKGSNGIGGNGGGGKQIGATGSSGSSGAGSGGKGGDGGSGGSGGAGGGGGGGAGGAVKLLASVLTAATAQIITGGGAGGTGASTGGNGRFLFGSNDPNGRPTSLSATNTDLNSLNQRIRETNPWTRLSGNAPLSTPLIAGIAGGADAGGLLDKFFFDLPLSIQDLIRPPFPSLGTPADALAAVVRVDATGEILSHFVDGTSINTDDYTGFDLLLFVNLTPFALTSPRLGIATFNGSTFDAPLSLGGIAADSLFGGSGSRTILNSLNNGAIFATLVPNGTVFVNASLGPNATLSNFVFSETTQQVQYVKALQPISTVKPKLQGLENILLSPDGSQVYGTDFNNNALAVVNTDNFTSRQLIKFGDAIKTSSGPVSIPTLSNPIDIAVSSDGNTLYAADLFSRLSVFHRESTGRLSELQQTVTSNINFDITLNENGSKLFVVGTFLESYTVGNDGSLTLALSKNATEVIGSTLASSVEAKGNFLFVTSSTNDSLFVLDPNTFAVIDVISGASNGLDGVNETATFGNFVYATSEDGRSIAVFRQANDGKLTFVQKLIEGQAGVRGLSDVRDLIVTPKGGYIIAASTGSNGLSVFRRNPVDGTLKFVQLIRNGVGNAEGLLAPTSLAISPDGQTLFVGSYGNSDAGIDGGIVSFPLALYFLENPSQSEFNVAVARNGTNLTTDVALNFVLDDIPIAVNVLAGSFATNDDLLAHIQAAIDAAVAAAGKSNFGGIAVRFDVEGFIRFTGEPTAIDIKTNFQAIKDIVVSTADGRDNIQLRRSPESDAQTLTISTTQGNDTVALLDLLPQIPGSPNTPTTIVNLGGGNDVAQLRSKRENTSVIVNGGNGQDDIRVIASGPGQVTVINMLTASANLNLAFSSDEPTLASRAVTQDTVTIVLSNLDATSTTTVSGNSNSILHYDTQGATAIVSGNTLQVSGKGTVTYTGINQVTEIFPPIVRFINPPTQITEGQDLSIEIEVLPRNMAGKLNKPVEWDFDGDGIFGDFYGSSLFEGFSRETISLTWSQLVALGILDSGNHQIAFRAENDEGTSETFFNLTVLNAPQVVSIRNETQPNFDLPAIDGAAVLGVPYRIFFDAVDPGEDRPQEWLVDWGDGTSEVYGSGIRSAMRSFPRPGEFTITVGVVDEDSAPNASATATMKIAVALNPLAVTIFGGPFSVIQGGAATLNGSALGTAEGLTWDLNGDNNFGDATGARPTLTWNELIALGIDRAGNYPIAFRARYLDTSGSVVSSPSVTSTLTVVNVAPKANLGNAGPVNEGSPATVSFNNMFDPSSTEQAALTYSFDFDNNGIFDAGLDIVDSTSSTANVPASLLAQSGILTIRGLVKDLNGAQTESFASLIINDVAPTINISTASTSIVEGSPFAITAQVTDPGADTISRWNIEWGDGIIETFFGNLRNFSHVYGDDGTYTVKATAFDDDGFYEANLASTVVVTNSLPTIANLAAMPTTEGGDMNLTGQITDAGSLDPFTVQVNWGDGTLESILLAAGTTFFDIGHRYQDNGLNSGVSNPYTISVKVFDDDVNNSSDASTTVAISNVAPTIDALSFSNAGYNLNVPTFVTGRIGDVGLLDTHIVSIAWSDGTSSAATVDPITRIFQASHPFQTSLVNGVPNGQFTANVTITDDDGGQVTGATSANVLNSIPRAINDAKRGQTNRAVDLNVLANDSDADGNDTINPSSVTFVMQPTVGTLSMQPDGSVRFVPPTDFKGQVQFSYLVTDTLLADSNPALVTLNIVDAFFQNERNRFDVNDDGFVSPTDVLVIINSIRRGGTRVLGEGELSPPYIDVDGDGSVAPIDILQVINELRRRSRQPSSEGESIASGSLSATFPNQTTGHLVDKAFSVPDYIDSFTYRKRSQHVDVAFSEYGNE